MKKICIVTSRHISYNPRVLKEADALHARGYLVSVVTINNHSLQSSFDRELMKNRQWTLQTVNFRKEPIGEKLTWIYLSLKHRIATLLSSVTLKFGLAERAANKAYDQLTRLAVKEKADLYLTHHPETLGIGYVAAKINKARLGFDAEDYHTGMNESPGQSAEEILTEYLERKYLPHCSYLTAASKGIALAYKDKYGIELPEVLLNVFPRQKCAVGHVNDPVRFYWYSQVIGPNRGLELLLAAAGQVPLPFELHFRGSIYNPEYLEHLKTLSEKLGIGEKVFYHEPILSERIIPDANNFDVGLALESDISVNRNICVTNKIFSYLMSGLAIIGTDTVGQADIFTHFPGAVRMCRMNDPESLAEAMRSYISRPEDLLEARRSAINAAGDPFNWERESEKMLTHIAGILNVPN